MGREVIAITEGELIARSEAELGLPASVDNSELPCFPPIGTQDPLPSCVSFAVTYYQLTHNMGLYLGRNNKTGTPGVDLVWYSPKWTYDFFNGGSASGTSFVSTYHILEQHGAVTWQEFPYDGLDYLKWCRNTTAWRNALSSRTNTPQTLTAIDTDAGLLVAKQMLANAYVLVFHLPAQFETTTLGNDPDTSADDPYIGQTVAYWLPHLGTRSHAMTFVGYNDDLWTDINDNGAVDPGEKGALKVADSHGNVGNSGYFWFAYDLLKTVSAVEGGPSSADRAGINQCYHLPIRPDYAPSLIAEFTVSHARRNELGLELGTGGARAASPSTTWTPSVIWYQGGPYAFDGGTAAIDGTFVYDCTDLMPTGLQDTRYFLELIDKTRGDEAATLSMFKLIDLEAQREVQSITVPRTANGTYGLPVSKRVYAYLNYARTDPDSIAAPSNLAASVSSKTATLTWLDNSNNEEGFFIERSAAPQYVYQQVGGVSQNVTSYSEILSTGRYRYRVQAFNLTTGRLSDYSNVVDVRIR